MAPSIVETNCHLPEQDKGGELKRMPRDLYDRCGGPIPGLYLPRRVWNTLEKKNITTFDQLRAVADRIERVLDGIGAQTAQMIRAELARVTPPEKSRSRDP